MVVVNFFPAPAANGPADSGAAAGLFNIGVFVAVVLAVIVARLCRRHGWLALSLGPLLAGVAAAVTVTRPGYAATQGPPTGGVGNPHSDGGGGSQCGDAGSGHRALVAVSAWPPRCSPWAGCAVR